MGERALKSIAVPARRRVLAVKTARRSSASRASRSTRESESPARGSRGRSARNGSSRRSRSRDRSRSEEDDDDDAESTAESAAESPPRRRIAMMSTGRKSPPRRQIAMMTTGSRLPAKTIPMRGARRTPSASQQSEDETESDTSPKRKPSSSRKPSRPSRSRSVGKKGAKKSPRELRLLQVEDEIQNLHNQPFLKGEYKDKFRFKIGDGVIAFSKGVYYEGQIISYYRTCVPDSIMDPKNPPPLAERIPSYWVRFSGWTPKFDEEVPENEMTSRVPGVPVNTLGMLYAHEWNDFKRELKNLSQEEVGRGSWFLQPKDYQILETEWQADTGQRISFKEYCGANMSMNIDGEPPRDED